MSQATHGRMVAGLLAGLILAATGTAQADMNTPNDPEFVSGNQDYLKRQFHGTGTFAGPDGNGGVMANAGTTTSGPLVIILISEGLPDAASHQTDLAPKMLAAVDLAGSNFSNPTADRDATAVAGIAAAVTDNGLGIAGVCPLCNILPVRTANMADYDAIATAITVGVQTLQTVSSVATDRAVILLIPSRDHPIATAGNLNTLQNLLDTIHNQQGLASGKSIVVLAAAGDGIPMPNGGTMPTPNIDPLCQPNLTNNTWTIGCVGGVDTMNLEPNTHPRRMVASNYGPYVRYSAPGQHLRATLPAGVIDRYDGTNAAAAIIAGIAARALANHAIAPTPAQIMDQLSQHVLREIGPTGALVYPTFDQTFPALTKDHAVLGLATLPDAHTTRLAAMVRALAETFEALFGVPEVWAACNTTTNAQNAQLTQPGNNYLVLPASSDAAFNSFILRGRAIGDGHKLEISRHDCNALTCPPNGRSYNAAGTILKCGNITTGAVVPSVNGYCPWNPPVNLNSPFSPLLTVGPTVSPGLPIANFEEGWYTIRLWTLCPGNEMESSRDIFIDRSQNPTFNGGHPMAVTTNTMVGEATLIDLNGDNQKEIVIGTAGTNAKVLAYNSSGTIVFESQPLAGRIFDRVAAGDFDGDGLPELVAGVDASGVASVVIWDADVYTGTPIAPKASRQVGNVKGAPTVVPDIQGVTNHDSILVTSVDNLLHWLEYDGTPILALNGQSIPTTCIAPPPGSCDPLASPYINHPNAPNACNDIPLQDTEAVVSYQQPSVQMPNGETWTHTVAVSSEDAKTSFSYGLIRNIGPATWPYASQIFPAGGVPWWPIRGNGEPQGPGPGGLARPNNVSGYNQYQPFLVTPRYIKDINPTCGTAGNPPCVDTMGWQLTIANSDQSYTTMHWLVMNNPAIAGALLYPRHTSTPGPLHCPTWSTAPEQCHGINDVFAYMRMAIGDIEQGDNGQLEGVWTGAIQPQLYGADASFQSMWATNPQTGQGRGAVSPVVADLDNDGQFEILVRRSDGLLWAFKPDGSLKIKMSTGQYGFPRAMADTHTGASCVLPAPTTLEFPRQYTANDLLKCSSASIGNMDNAGHLDIVVNGVGWIQVLELQQSGIARKSTPVRLLQKMWAKLRSTFEPETAHAVAEYTEHEPEPTASGGSSGGIVESGPDQDYQRAVVKLQLQEQPGQPLSQNYCAALVADEHTIITNPAAYAQLSADQRQFCTLIASNDTDQASDDDAAPSTAWSCRFIASMDHTNKDRTGGDLRLRANRGTTAQGADVPYSIRLKLGRCRNTGFPDANNNPNAPWTEVATAHVGLTDYQVHLGAITVPSQLLPPKSLPKQPASAIDATLAPVSPTSVSTQIPDQPESHHEANDAASEL